MVCDLVTSLIFTSFDYKLGCFYDNYLLKCMDTHPHLELKTRARFHRASQSLSMLYAKILSAILPSVVVKKAHGAVLACARSRSRARPRSFGRAPPLFGRAQLRRCAMDS
jgi:hypothetical protein